MGSALARNAQDQGAGLGQPARQACDCRERPESVPAWPAAGPAQRPTGWRWLASRWQASRWPGPSGSACRAIRRSIPEPRRSTACRLIAGFERRSVGGSAAISRRGVAARSPRTRIGGRPPRMTTTPGVLARGRLARCLLWRRQSDVSGGHDGHGWHSLHAGSRCIAHRRNRNHARGWDQRLRARCRLRRQDRRRGRDGRARPDDLRQDGRDGGNRGRRSAAHGPRHART